MPDTFLISSQTSVLGLFSSFGTNLGPVLVELIVKHIKLPLWCKSRILEDVCLKKWRNGFIETVFLE